MTLPARFVVVQRASSLAVAALGFAALAVGGELSGVAAMAALAAIALSAWPGRPTLSPRTWLAVQLGFLAWLLGGQLLGSRHLLLTFAHLLVFVQVHRLLTRSSARDDLYSYFIAFGQLLLASVLTVDAGFLLVFVGYLVTLTWAMLLTRLALAVERDERQQNPDRPVPAAAWTALKPLVRFRFFAVSSALVLALLVSTLALFFILPRLEASFLSAQLLPPVHVSGFSESVGLGEIGMVQLSDEPVMRVRVFDRDGAALPAGSSYWRGLALDRFDGRQWSLSDPSVTPLAWIGSANSHGPPRKAPWSIRQEITLEPLDSRVLFHHAEATGLYGDFRSLEAVQTAGLFAPGLRRRSSYTVYSEPTTRDLDRLRQLDPRASDPLLIDLYTQLPSDLAPVVPALAEEWTRGAATPVDAALLLQDRLREDFTYSLEQPASGYPDPLAAFLGDVREGHCEYFATAMVVMARTQSLPARIVNGFQGGTWNPVGEYWLVRQREAHSWVEIHFPEVGWVVFDPTPAAGGGVEGTARIRLLARLGAWADYGRVRWSDVMLDYGLDNQADGLRAFARFLSGSGSLDLGSLTVAVPELPDGGERRGTARLGLLILAGIGLLGLLGLAGRVRRGPGQVKPELRRAARLVERLEARWRRSARGVEDAPGPGSTAMEWACWVASATDVGDAPSWIDRYYASRFGGKPVTAELTDGLKGLLRVSPRRPARRARSSSSRR